MNPLSKTCVVVPVISKNVWVNLGDKALNDRLGVEWGVKCAMIVFGTALGAKDFAQIEAG